MNEGIRDWTELYRPQRFEDVRGQVVPRRYLGGLVLDGFRRDNILLFGDVGSGKTSLAKIYARALNCAHPNPHSGSPCMECENCLTRAGNLSEYDVPLKGGDVASVRHFVQSAVTQGRHGRPHVVFFDEAQSLSDKACLYLLKQLETAHILPTSPAFVFATTAPEKLSPALRSRLKRLHVTALEHDEALLLLSGIAETEDLEVENGALDLVVRYAGCQPRDLVGVMQVVADPKTKSIRVATAKEAFGYDQVDDLEDYFLALAAGRLSQMTAIFDRWRQPIAQKVEWIQAYLTSFYIRTIRGLDAVIDPVVDTLMEKRVKIANTYLGRLGLTELAELAPTWRAMMQFWAERDDGASDAGLGLRMAVFHERCVSADWVSRFPRASHKGTTLLPSPVIMPKRTNDALYLDTSHLRDIFNGASYLVQRTGNHLNLLLKITSPRDQDISHAESIAFVDQRLAMMEDTLAGLLADQAPVLSAIRVAENTLYGPLGHIAAHIPDADHPDDEELAPQHAILAWAATDPSVEVRVSPRSGGARNGVHWRIVRELVAGYSLEDVPLREKLKLKTERIVTGLRGDLARFWGRTTPFADSASLAPSFELQSKFDAGLFAEIDTGWELKAFQARSGRNLTLGRLTDA